MISIIICTRKPYLDIELKDNIAETIGVDYEIVLIDNSKNNYSIFSAYNEGVIKSKYPYLCFMHDDIRYHSMNWGLNVVHHFDGNKNIGLIGVFGTHYLPKIPTAVGMHNIFSINLLQNDGLGNVKKNFRKYIESGSNSLNAVTIDGMWFCIPLILFKKIKFDAESLKGFHGYDTDICLQVIKNKHAVHVVFDILIEHFSLGKPDKEWLKNTMIVFKKWEKVMPVIALEGITENEIWKAHNNSVRKIIKIIRKQNMVFKYEYKIWFYYFKSMRKYLFHLSTYTNFIKWVKGKNW